MDMKSITKMNCKKHKIINSVLPVNIVIIYKYKRGGIYMLKFLAKVAEKYAKSTNSACGIFFFLHQPKMPASLVKKD